MITLDVDPRRDDDASPMSLYKCMSLRLIYAETYLNDYG